MSTLEERFWSRVRKCGPDECWEWIAGRDSYGYGAFRVNGVQCIASRVAWMIHTGASEMPPRSLDVMHSCDNPPCVNPAHLSIGTRQQNSDDMCSKGRQCRGTKHHKAKLSEDVVRAVRARIAADESDTAISVALGVSRRTVRDVRVRRTWKHVD